MTVEQDFVPETSPKPRRPERPDRGPRLFVGIATASLLGVIGWSLVTGHDGFISSVDRFLHATPAPSASPSDAASPSTSP